jgi:hypothetical protein
MNSDRSDFTPSFENDFSTLIKGLTEKNAANVVHSMNYFYQHNCGPWLYQLDRRDAMIWLVSHIQNAFGDNAKVNRRCKSFFKTVEFCEARWTNHSNPDYNLRVSNSIEYILGPDQDFNFSKLYLEKQHTELCLDTFLVC